jgi:hypothetical protein
LDEATRQDQEIRYDVLIDRVIKTFRPAKMLWPVDIRLAIWLAVEIAIIVPFVLWRSGTDLLAQLHNFQYMCEVAVFTFIGIAAACLALRTAIPARQATRGELLLIFAAGLAGVLLIVGEPVQTSISLGQFLRVGSICLLYMVSLAALPWIALFWAVRRGVPLEPRTSGRLIGLGTFCFAFVATRLAWPVNDSLHLLTWQLLPIVLATEMSMLAGALWLPRQSSASGRGAAGAEPSRLARLTWRGGLRH